MSQYLHIFLLLYICLPLSHPASANDQEAAPPLSWQPNSPPSILQILKSPLADVDLLLLKAPVLRTRTSQAKVRLRQIPLYVELKSIARQSHNAKRSIRKLKNAEFSVKSSFDSCPSCVYEFQPHPHMAFSKCEATCQSQNAAIADDFALLDEIRKTKISVQDFNNLWIQSKQTASHNGYFSASHSVSIKDSNVSLPLLPQNQLSTCPNPASKVSCLSFDVSGNVGLDCHDLPTMVKYYERRNGVNVYYPEKFFALQVRLMVDSSFELSREAQLTNLTFLEFQRYHASFELILAPSASELLAPHQLSQCVCFRPKFWRLDAKNSMKSRIQALALKSENLEWGIERFRLSEYANFQQSNGDFILNNLPHIESLPPIDQFITDNDIHTLILNTTLSALFHNSSEDLPDISDLIKGIQEEDLLSFSLPPPMTFSGRNKRGIPLSAATLLAKLAAPYLLSQSSEIMDFLKRKLSGEFFSSRDKGIQLGEQANLSSYLGALFNNEVSFAQSEDRLSADIPDLGSMMIFEEKFQALDDSMIDHLDVAMDKILHFQDNAVQKLSEAFLFKLGPFINARIRPNGKVLVSVQKAHSFLRFSYIFEEELPESAITSYVFNSLPHSRQKNQYTSLDIQNLTVDLSHNSIDMAQGATLPCHKLLIGSVPVPVDKVCPHTLSSFVDFQHLQSLSSLNFFLLKGESVLHFKCPGSHGESITLSRELNLIMAHNQCSLGTRLPSGRRWASPAVPPLPVDPFMKVNLVVLLAYDLTPSSSFQTLTRTYLTVITVAICVLAVLLLLASAALVYFKRKLQVATVAAFFRNSEHPLENLEWESQCSQRSASVEIASLTLPKKEKNQNDQSNPAKPDHPGGLDRPTSLPAQSGTSSFIDPPIRSLPMQFSSQTQSVTSSSPPMASTFLNRASTVKRSIPSKPASHLYPSFSADGDRS